MDDVDYTFASIENEGLRARVVKLETENAALQKELDHMYRIFDIQDKDTVKLILRHRHVKRALCLAAKILAGTVMCPKRSQHLCAELDCPRNEPPVRCWHKIIETSIQRDGVLAQEWRDLLEEVTR